MRDKSEVEKGCSFDLRTTFRELSVQRARAWTRVTSAQRYNVFGFTSLAPWLDSSQVPTKLPRKYVQRTMWSVRKGTMHAVISDALYSASLLDMPDTRHVFEIRYMWKRVMCHEKRAYNIFTRIIFPKKSRFF